MKTTFLLSVGTGVHYFAGIICFQFRWTSDLHHFGLEEAREEVPTKSVVFIIPMKVLTFDWFFWVKNTAVSNTKFTYKKNTGRAITIGVTMSRVLRNYLMFVRAKFHGNSSSSLEKFFDIC